MRVLPDVPAIDKEFDYLVPDGWEVGVGDVVRIDLQGRRVGGWVVQVDVEPGSSASLKPLAKVSGRGPAPELIDLAGWAAWRWAGRRASFLRTASPPGVVRSLPALGATPASAATAGAVEPPTPTDAPTDASADASATIEAPSDPLTEALGAPRAVLRLAPGADRYPLVRAAVSAPSPVPGGRCLVLCPSASEARALGRRLRRDGVATAIVAHDGPGAAAAGEWARAAAGAVVVGARAAAWAPVAPLGRVVVLDEHDEAYQQEQSPTWHARDVVLERAARAGAPCLLVSPCPTLEALDAGPVVTTSRGEERAGWSRIEVVDQRQLDPALGPLFSPTLVSLVRGPGRVLCVLNRTGRARMVACAACSTLARCQVCDAAVGEPAATDPGVGPTEPGFACPRCGASRPKVCLECGGARFKLLRLGVSRAREELQALVGEPVGEVTAATDVDDAALGARVVIGTEAVLHRIGRADAVAFLDFDQELLAPRFRAAEQALAMLARASRVAQRGAGAAGRLLVQTRSPDHPVLVAARRADPGRLVESERALRSALDLPPATAMALVSGQSAPAFVESLRERIAGEERPDLGGAVPAPAPAPHRGRAGVRIQGPVEGTWRLVAPDHAALCDALAAVTRPPGRLRTEVDPLRA